MSLVFTACSNDDNPSSDSSGGKEYTGIPLIILDTDIASSTDDLFAMQMLYRYADEGKCKFLGVESKCPAVIMVKVKMVKIDSGTRL